MTKLHLQEQADGGGKSHYHGWLKNQKHKAVRREVKKALRDEEKPIDTYGKYKGWET